MKACCFGSLNIDYTYDVPHFVTGGETLASSAMNVYTGGKGLNQAMALARAGMDVRMAGAVGPDGRFLLQALEEAGVDCSGVSVLHHVRTGNAIIQRDASGANCILLFGGANQVIDEEHARRALEEAEAGDLLVLQNEISAMDAVMRIGKEKGMRIAFNASPMNEKVYDYPLELMDLLLVNEVEAAGLLGHEVNRNDPAADALALRERFPQSAVLLTLGASGAVYADGETAFHQPAFVCDAVDTTGAGDTFTGYVLAALSEGRDPHDAVRTAALAASMAVMRPGAASSVPTKEEVEKKLAELR